MTIRVLIVDDHPVMRSGVAGVLSVEDDIEVVGEAGNGAEAVKIAARLRPDVVLMDLRMPTLDGVGATQQILANAAQAPAVAIAAGTPNSTPHATGNNQASPTRVLVLTTHDTDADILRAVEAGATGYLLKDSPPDVLVNGIRAAARGEIVLEPNVAIRLVGNVRTTAERLTPRETQVLALVAEGMSNAEVAQKLFIGEATVKTHLVRVFNKLGVADRTGAVTEARRRGYLT